MKDGRERKSMYLDIKTAYVIPVCEQVVYVELPAEAEVQEDECGKLILGKALFGTSQGTWLSEVAVGTCGIRTRDSGLDGRGPR